ncbi:MAG: DUF86 domain-containing protein [Spirochaetaceae bacterium]|nr:DUF86 domain-containing protein [Spirochaetaceae bacterium]
MESPAKLESTITAALESFPGLSFAFLFGSAVTGRMRRDSDIDVAVYGDSDGMLEIEAEREFQDESEIQIALERATNRNVDLLVLNRAPATVCAAALLSGRAVLIRDGRLLSRYFLAVTTVAMDFLQTEREFRDIRSRSRSLSEIDRNRLARILDFVDEELEDREKFRQVGLTQYRSDRDMRRNLDRWTEMLINAAIDIGKIVLSSEHRSVPQTYGQILADLVTVPGFTELGGRLKQLAGVRNVLAHEYLDLRFGRVQNFVESGSQAVKALAEMTRGYEGR